MGLTQADNRHQEFMLCGSCELLAAVAVSYAYSATKGLFKPAPTPIHPSCPAPARVSTSRAPSQRKRLFSDVPIQLRHQARLHGGGSLSVTRHPPHSYRNRPQNPLPLRVFRLRSPHPVPAPAPLSIARPRTHQQSKHPTFLVVLNAPYWFLAKRIVFVPIGERPHTAFEGPPGQLRLPRTPG